MWWAQNRNSMHGGFWSDGWIGDYGWIWMQILRVAVVGFDAVKGVIHGLFALPPVRAAKTLQFANRG